MGADFTIRCAVPADEPAILALVPRLTDFGPPAWRQREAMTRTDLKVIAAALRSAADSPVVLVVVCEARIAGFIHLALTRDYYTEQLNAHVADVVVATEFEGRGLAKALLERAVDWARARGSQWLTISVFGDNVHAAQLYERLGFKQDIIRMVKPLS